MTKGITKALIISIAVHALVIGALLFNPFSTSLPPQITKKTTKPIKSFIYTPPKSEAQPRNASPSDHSPNNLAPSEPQKTHTALSTSTMQKVPKKVTQPINTPTKKVIQEDFINDNKQQNAEYVQPNQPVSMNNEIKQNKSPAVFNPYKSRTRFAEQLQQNLQADLLEEQSQVRGFSSMQPLPAAVSASTIKKTSLQKRQEATTQVGNETFVKQNGTCMQTTDLSFIDDNLGSVTSFSDCGESDDEKYFRQFMNNKLKKHRGK